LRNKWIILALILCVFGNTTGEFVIAGILPDVAQDLKVSISSAGLLVTAYAMGMIVGGPVLTALTVRYSRKTLIICLLFVSLMGNIASMLAPSYPLLFIARTITSFVTSTFFANAIVIAALAASPGKQASAVSKLAFGMNLAMIMGAPIGTFIGNHFGWRTTFLAIAVCCAIGLLSVYRLLPHGPKPYVETSPLAEFKVFRKRDVRLAIAITVIGNAGLLAVFTYLSPLLTNVAGFAPDAVSILLMVYGVGATIGNFLGGWLSDRAPMPSQFGLLTALAVALVSMWIFGTVMTATSILVFIIGMLGFAVIPGMQSRVLATATDAPTLAIAVNASAYQLAAAFAGWFGGQVIDSVLGLKAIYLVSAAVTCIGVLLSLYAWRQSKKADGEFTISRAHQS
jgi:DHA1 family inner membrane transport protein